MSKLFQHQKKGGFEKVKHTTSPSTANVIVEYGKWDPGLGILDPTKHGLTQTDSTFVATTWVKSIKIAMSSSGTDSWLSWWAKYYMLSDEATDGHGTSVPDELKKLKDGSKKPVFPTRTC